MKSIHTLLFLVAAFPANAVLITPIQNSSSVSVSGSGGYVGGSTTYASSIQALPGALTILNGTATLPVPSGFLPDTEFSQSNARQLEFSDIAAGTIAAASDVGADARSATEELFNSGWSSHAVGGSVFDLVFQVNEVVGVEILGQMYGQSHGVTSFTLSSFGGATIFESSHADTVSGSWSMPFSLTGTLNPGTYQLIASAESSTTGNRHDSEGGASGFTFRANFQPANVPDGGSTLALLVGALVLLGCVRTVTGAGLQRH